MKADILLTHAASQIEGPLLFLKRNVSVGLYEAVEVSGADGISRIGRVAALDGAGMVVEILEETRRLALEETVVRLTGEPVTFPVGPGLLGRTFNGVGVPMDGGPPVAAREFRVIDAPPVNPARRAVPSEYIETGVTSIDLMNTLVRGQKLPIFSGGGLPHDRLAVDILQRARLPGAEGEHFAIVFVGIGVPYSTADRFRNALQSSGALDRSVMFLNMASDATPQRLLTPRFALTAAEYLAFSLGYHVLVILTDMTNYCEGLREVSSSHGEIPGRKGFPAYMYSDLASIHERAGRIEDGKGSVTQLPILTMPGDDISHPIPDLTGYITEGQIVLSRDLARKDIYPPVDVLPSLSRLMHEGAGAGLTHEDHPALASQLYAAYASAIRVRTLASVVGVEGLSALDREYLALGDDFERKLIAQSEARTLAQSMEAAWPILRRLPPTELSRLSDDQIAHYLGAGGASETAERQTADPGKSEAP